MRPMFLCAVFFVVTAATYAGALQGTFQYDDLYTILINPHLDRWGTFVGHLDHMVRPVLYGTYLLNRSFNGNDPAGYHLLNLSFHMGSGLFLYAILRHAVTEKTRHIPFWTASLFLIHPIQTEAVTYISGRASSLMAFFYLFGFLLYIKASESPHAVIVRRLYLFGAVLSLLLSLGSKETAVTFPLLLLLWDGLIRRLRGASFRSAILSNHLPFWLVLVAVGLWAFVHPRYSALAQFSLGIRPLWGNFLSELHAATYAVLLFFCSWRQNFDHDVPQIHSLLQWPLPLELLAWSGLAVVAVVSVRRLPLLSFGIGWFILQMLPTTVIPRNDLLSERNLYLASIGVLLVTVVLCSRVVQWLMTVLPYPRVVRFGTNGIALTFVLLLCFFTYQRNILYHGEVSLWSDAVGKSPHKARPHNNLGHAYAMQGNWDRAIEEFRTAAQLDPAYGPAQKNLRDAYLHQVGRQ
ncbi:MAG: tetratricopeptide repeat protein [Nitrospiraceae bacterium]|nr:tetratricopeptide repeat protein [Nitrospiraceae bacterium]